MSIRLRQVDGVGLVALCAARSIEKPGDVWLDDNQHHALAQKFARDFASEGENVAHRIEPDAAAACEIEESNNANRTWWDRNYGDAGRPTPDRETP